MPSLHQRSKENPRKLALDCARCRYAGNRNQLHQENRARHGMLHNTPCSPLNEPLPGRTIRIFQQVSQTRLDPLFWKDRQPETA